jgi:hypothetical protein
MKNMYKYLYIAITLAFVKTTSTIAQTLHTIVFCNTIDSSIGESMSLEFINVKSQIKTLAGLIDYDEDNHELDGKNCTRSNLKSIIDQLEIEEDDVILTFYGGHGSHAEDDPDPWPQYLMNSGFENQDNWVPMATLQKWIEAKHARLSVIISNCCNSIQAATTKKPLWAMGGDYTKLDNTRAENYKKLFAAKGLVMATSSRVSEPSWCGIPHGGLYTCDFIQAMKLVGTGEIAPDWNSVLNKAYDLCAARDIVDKEGQHHKQHPYQKFYSKGTSTPPSNAPRPRIDNDPLGQALLDLVNKDKDQAYRLSMIPNIVNKHFGGYNKVMTVGTDMQTAVDYEDPKDFLRRICLSPYIKQVNIVNKKGGILIVHEVRTK